MNQAPLLEDYAIPRTRPKLSKSPSRPGRRRRWKKWVRRGAAVLSLCCLGVGAYFLTGSTPAAPPCAKPDKSFLEVPAPMIAQVHAWDPELCPAAQPPHGSTLRFVTSLGWTPRADQARFKLEKSLLELEERCAREGVYPQGQECRLSVGPVQYDSLSGWSAQKSGAPRVQGWTSPGTFGALRLQGEAAALQPFLASRLEGDEIRAVLTRADVGAWLRGKAWTPLGLAEGVTHAELTYRASEGRGRVRLFGGPELASAGGDPEKLWAALPPLEMALVARPELFSDWLTVCDPGWSGCCWSRLTHSAGDWFGMAAELELSAEESFRAQWERWKSGAMPGAVALERETSGSGATAGWSVSQPVPGVTVLANASGEPTQEFVGKIPTEHRPSLMGAGKFAWKQRQVCWNAFVERKALVIEFALSERPRMSCAEPGPAEGPEVDDYRKTVRTIIAGQ